MVCVWRQLPCLCNLSHWFSVKLNLPRGKRRPYQANCKNKHNENNNIGINKTSLNAMSISFHDDHKWNLVISNEKFYNRNNTMSSSYHFWARKTLVCQSLCINVRLVTDFWLLEHRKWNTSLLDVVLKTASLIWHSFFLFTGHLDRKSLNSKEVSEHRNP